MTGKCLYCEEERDDLNEHGVCPDCSGCYAYCEWCGEYLEKDNMRDSLCPECYCERENLCDPLAGMMDKCKMYIEDNELRAWC